jgi:hypothetical protein
VALLAALDEIILVLVRAVRHAVGDGTRVRPEPRERPQDAAEEQRQHAQRVDRVLLRVMALLGDLLREDVNDPEDHQDDDRHYDEHEDRDPVGRGVQRFARQEGRARGGGRKHRRGGR